MGAEHLNEEGYKEGEEWRNTLEHHVGYAEEKALSFSLRAVVARV